MQVAARVPLVATDVLDGRRHASDRLGNGTHVLRMDMRRGEVRQVRAARESPGLRMTVTILSHISIQI